MPYCPGCGHQHADDARFCAQCGRALTADAVAPERPAPPPTPVEADPPGGEQILWEGAPHGLLNPIESHAIRWILTTERLRVIRGILTRSTEEIELTRVRDVSVEQGLTQRALGLGSVTLVGTDVTAPSLTMHDIEEPEHVMELIRQAVREQRRRFRVRQIEGDEQI